MRSKSKFKSRPKTKTNIPLILAIVFSLLGTFALYLGITWQRTVISPPKPNQTASPVLNKPTPTPIPSPIKRPNTGPLILTTPEGYTLSLPSDLITQYVAKPDGGYALFFTNEAAAKCQQTLNDYQAGIDISEDGCLLDTMFISFATSSNDEFINAVFTSNGGLVQPSTNNNLVWVVMLNGGEGTYGEAFTKHNNQYIKVTISYTNLQALDNSQYKRHFSDVEGYFLSTILSGINIP